MGNYINSLNDYTAPEFTAKQKKTISKYFTNLDRPVFAFTSEISNLDAATLVINFSKSKEKIREIFLKEFLMNPYLNYDLQENKTKNLDLEKDSIKFYRQHFTKKNFFEDAKLTNIFVAIENISIIALDFLKSEKNINVIEQETKLPNLGEKNNGKYKYFRDQEVISVLGKQYENICDTLFDRYRTWFERVRAQVIAENPMREDETEDYYLQAVHHRTNDILKNLLPIGFQNNIVINASGKDFINLIYKMEGNILEEIKALGKDIFTEITKVYPNLFERINVDFEKDRIELLKNKRELLNYKTQNSAIGRLNLNDKKESFLNIKLLSLSDFPLEKICSGFIYPSSHSKYEQLIDYFKLNKPKRDELIEQINLIRKSAEDKIIEGFEKVKISIEITAPISCWIEMEKLTKKKFYHNSYFINEGFYIAPEIKALGLYQDYKEVMTNVMDYIQSVKDMNPNLSNNVEYLVPQGANLRWIYDFTFAEVIDLIEGITNGKGNRICRYLMIKLYEELGNYYPDLQKLIKFADLETHIFSIY